MKKIQEIEDFFLNNKIKLLLLYGNTNDLDMIVGVFDYFKIISRKMIGKNNYVFNDSRLIFKMKDKDAMINIPVCKLIKKLNIETLKEKNVSFNLECLDAFYTDNDVLSGLNYSIMPVVCDDEIIDLKTMK